MSDDELWPVLADHPHDVAPQLQVWSQVAVLVTEKLDLLDAQDPRRGPLLLRADRDQLRVFLARVLAALRPICDDHVDDLRAAVDSRAMEPPAPKSGSS